MRALRPRSTVSLIVFGFGVVALPLVIALGYVWQYVDELSRQGQTTVYNAARAIQDSRSLADALTRLERSGRQYLLLDDPALLDGITEAHDAFQAAVERLRRLTPTDQQQIAIQQIGRREQQLYERLTATVEANRPAQTEVTERFIELGRLAEAIRRGSNRVIDREVDILQRTAATAQQWLFWIGVALLPLTAVSVAIFTGLISGPIRQVDRAIRQLGDGRFERPIRVRGPEDLRALGDRLEWLRCRLIDLENQKTGFLRHVSHELKTPLTAIRESSALLVDGSVGRLNHEQQEIAEILADSGRNLQTLIEDLIDFSRTLSARPKLHRRQVELAQIAEAVLRSHKPEVRAKSITVDRAFTACRLSGDPEKLKTVVDNLVSNAVKFAPRHSTVGVRIEDGGPWVIFSVSDAGPGIRAEDRDKVFEAFFQGIAQPGGYVQGSGLGLSITREYVLAHGGRIEILDAPGGGTVFRVTLPKEARAPADDEGAGPMNRQDGDV